MPNYPAWVRRLYSGKPNRSLTVEEKCLLEHFFDTPSRKFIPCRRGIGVNFLKSIERCHNCPRRNFTPGEEDLSNYHCWCSLPERIQPRDFAKRLKALAEEFS